MAQSRRGLQRGFASSMMEVQTPQQQAGFLAVWPQDRQAHLQLQQPCRQKTLHWQGLLRGLPLAKNGFLDGESVTSAVYFIICIGLLSADIFPQKSISAGIGWIHSTI